MANKVWVFTSLLLVECHLGEHHVHRRHNVVRGSAGSCSGAVQVALDWACGDGGGADCSPVQPGGACFEPDYLLSHASYVFNSYYQQNGNSDVACNFGGTAIMTTLDPSYGSCKFLASGPGSGTPPPPSFPVGASAFGILLYALIH